MKEDAIHRGKASTIEDVARLAGVSIKTVSRVVNREPNVRQATRLQVEAAVIELNYRPNVSARNLASQSARLIVLIYDDPGFYTAPSSGYIISLQQGALEACRERGYELLIHPCNFRSQQVVAELTTLISRIRPTGVIIAAPLSNMAQIVNAVTSSRAPCVLLSPGTKSSPVFSVDTTNRDSCRDMTLYLAELGHKRIAFIRGNPLHKAVGQRFLGYKEGLRKSGLSLDPALVLQGDNSIGSGEDCAERLLSAAKPPTAIFTANDDMAAGVLRTALRMGVAVPGQLSLAGCDDINLARQVYPSLTTIRQPLAAMSQRAAEALIEIGRKGPDFVGRVVIPAELSIRDSTGPAPAER